MGNRDELSPDPEVQSLKGGLNPQEEWFEMNMRNRTCRDAGWSVLHLLWLATVVGIIIAAGITVPYQHIEGRFNKDDQMDVVWIAIGISVLWGFIYLLLIRLCAKFLVWLTIIGSVVLTLAGCGFFVYLATATIDVSGQVFAWITVVAIFVIFICECVFICVFHKKIQLSVVLLEESSIAIITHPAVIVVTFFIVFLYVGIFAFLVYGVLEISEWKGYEWLLVFVLPYFIWSYWLTIGILRTTVGGVVAGWYFAQGNRSVAGLCPAIMCFWRAMTTSHGSICEGSFLLAMVTYVLTWIRMLTDGVEMREKLEPDKRNCCAMCLLKCCLCHLKTCCFCFLNAMKWLSQYAYVYIGAFGIDFASAGREAMRLLELHGIMAVVSDSVTWHVGMFGAFVGFLLASTGIVASQMHSGRDWDPLVTFIAFLCGLVVSYLWVVILDCGVDAILVCFAADLEQFSKTNHLFARKKFVELLKDWGWTGNVDLTRCTI